MGTRRKKPTSWVDLPPPDAGAVYDDAPFHDDWHLVMTGRGRPVVVVHGGLGLDHTHLVAPLEPLTAHARLILPDLRGNGRTPPPFLWDGFNLVNWAEDLDALRISLGLPRWTVLGHSLGSFVALEYAIRYPGHLDGLVLVSSSGAFEHTARVVDNARARGAPEVVEQFVGAFSAPVPDDAAFAALWPAILPLYFHRWDDRHVDAFAGTRYSADALNASLAAVAAYDVRERLKWVRCPTLVVSGDDDFITPADLGAELAARIEGARQVVIPSSGHFPFLEQPGPFTAAVRELLTAR